MKRYYFELLDSSYEELPCLVPDGSSKKSAVNCAKKWMRENGVIFAQLSVNSLTTSNLLDIIDIAL